MSSSSIKYLRYIFKYRPSLLLALIFNLLQVVIVINNNINQNIKIDKFYKIDTPFEALVSENIICTFFINSTLKN